MMERLSFRKLDKSERMSSRRVVMDQAQRLSSRNGGLDMKEERSSATDLVTEKPEKVSSTRNVVMEKSERMSTRNVGLNKTEKRSKRNVGEAKLDKQSTRRVIIDGPLEKDVSSSNNLDSSSVSTDVTHELTPSPKVVNRRGSLLRRSKRNEEDHSHLFLPSLDMDDTAAVVERKAYFWNSLFMIVVYVCLLGTFLLNNKYVLYGIPLFLFFETCTLVSKWSGYFAADPYVLQARKGFQKHQKRIAAELRRTMNGGALRRRQEILMAGVGYTSVFYWQDYFERKAAVIDQRTLQEFKTRISRYTSGKDA